MPKSRTTISVDNDLIEQAHEKGINISGLTEQAIREKLNRKEVEANQPLKCEFCNQEGFKETAEDIEEKGHYSEPNAITWLVPNEQWICNRCLRKLKPGVI